jgi:hypothetical protein
MRKYYASFCRVRGNILPLEAVYRVVLDSIHKFDDIFILNLLKKNCCIYGKLNPLPHQKTCLVVLIAEKWNIMIFADFSSIQPKARNIFFII